MKSIFTLTETKILIFNPAYFTLQYSKMSINLIHKFPYYKAGTYGGNIARENRQAGRKISP